MIFLKRLKSILSLLLCIIMAMQTVNIITVAAANDYENHWAKAQITDLMDRNIVNGYNDGSVKPDNNISRAEFVTLVNKLFNYTDKADSNFPDVNGSMWYAGEFLKAKAAGYITGDQNGNANPENAITRAEVCVIASKVLNLDGVSFTVFTDDSSLPHWAKMYIGAMSKAGLIKGYPDGSFGASKNITRAEAFVIISNILNTNDDTKDKTITPSISAEKEETTEAVTEKETTETTTRKHISGGGGGGGGSSSGGGNSSSGSDSTTETTTSAVPGTNTGNFITRQQWIHRLVSTLGLMRTDSIKVQNDEDPNYTDGTVLETYGNEEYPYIDIEDSEYLESIITAYEYGVISKENEEEAFNPDAPATREFAAYTSVKALNFMEGQANTEGWADAAQLKYPIQDSIAVDAGILSLDRNRFNPEAVVKESLASAMLNKVQEINAPVEIDENAENIIEYAEGVKVLDNVTDYVISDDEKTVTINAYTGDVNIAANDVIVLPPTSKYPSGYAYTAESVEMGNVIVISGHFPESLADVITHMELEGSGGTVIGDIVPEEGVVIEDEVASAAAIMPVWSYGGSTGTILSKKLSFDKKIMNGNGKVNGSIKLEIPSIDYKIDISPALRWPPIKINDLYFVVNQEAKVDGNLTVSYSNNGLTGSEKLKIATIPITICPGVSLNVVVWLSIDAEGNFSVSYTLENQYGIQVVNNNPRIVNNCSSDLNVKLEGSIKLGANLGLMLNVLSKWDLVDIATEAGVGANARAETHTNPRMICIDGKIYLYWEISALENSLAGEIFHKTFNYEIFNEGNSPVKKKIHLEDREDTNGFVVVPECTYGRGTLKGYVADARDRNNAIANATATIYNARGERVKKLYSDSHGEYSCALQSGNYRLRVTADGYKTFDYSFSVESGQETYAETLLLIDENSNGNGICDGNIINSVTSAVIPDVSISAYKNWNNTDSDVVASAVTDINGDYTLTLPAGNYTFKFECEGYVPITVNVAVLEGDNRMNYYLVPVNSEIISGGDLKIELSWTGEPSDLDSHLVGPSADGSGTFHTFFANMDYYDNNTRYVNLDRDDIDYEGPETTTIYKKNDSGIYSFYVHDYTNRYSSNSYVMSRSGAQVKVFSGDRELTKDNPFNIPVNRIGTVWHVFDYNAATGVITPVNTFSDCVEPDHVGSSISYYSNADPIALSGLKKPYEIVSDNESEKESNTDEMAEEAESLTNDEMAEEEITENTSAEETISESADTESDDIITEDVSDETNDEYVFDETNDEAAAEENAITDNAVNTENAIKEDIINTPEAVAEETAA